LKSESKDLLEISGGGTIIKIEDKIGAMLLKLKQQTRATTAIRRRNPFSVS
jgi:hypothetical protein